MLETRKIDLENMGTSVAASVLTDAGCVREANEDSGRHIRPNDTAERLGKGSLTIVADGMGGHASGEIASQMAVDLISEFYYSDDELDGPLALKEAVEMANVAIYRSSITDEKYFGMGTTVIALVLQGGVAFSAHVGDSRLYRMRDDQLEMLTLDHSQVMEMVKHGILSMEEARHHDDKNVILRAVGTQPEVDVEISEPFAVEMGDVFLLCSDGLSDMLDDEAIEEIMRAETDVHAASERLIAEAKENGGHDNVTVCVLRIGAQNEHVTGRPVRVTREVEVLK